MSSISKKYVHTGLKGKILALDIGSKRIGYAVSDNTATVCFPRETFARESDERALASIVNLARSEAICTIVIGIPLDSDNNETTNSRSIRAFGGKIEHALGLPISYVDEFGTTDEALAKIPFRKDRRSKGSADPIAAQIILQRFLDNKK